VAKQAKTLSSQLQEIFPTPQLKLPAKKTQTIFDGLFLWDARREGGAVSLTGVYPNGGLTNDYKEWRELQDKIPFALSLGPEDSLFLASLGMQPLATTSSLEEIQAGKGVFTPIPGYKPATSFQESIQLLKAHAATLSVGDKLSILRAWGNLLLDGYGGSGSGKTAFETIFQNAKAGQSNGGVCRDIAPYLAEVAKALGFKSAGSASTLWERKKGTGGHVITYYQDPETGEYYAQNYDDIVNTHQKTLPATIDVATQALSTLTGTSIVNSAPGEYHLYVPRRARWVTQQLNAIAATKPNPAYITAKVSNLETTFVLQIQGNPGSDSAVKGFFLHSAAQTSEGEVKLDAIGIAGQVTKNETLSHHLLDAVGYEASGKLGYLQISAPNIAKDTLFTSGKERMSRQNLFLGVDIKGYARIDQTTGKLALRASSIDAWKKETAGANISTPDNQLTPSLEYRLKTLPVTIEAGRTLQVTGKDQFSKVDLKTAYDKVNIVVDRRGHKDAVVIISNSEAYLFGGAEQRDAIGLRQLLSVAVPTEKHGEFSVIFDISKIIENKKEDPFYDLPLFASLKAQWKKAVGRLIEIGTDVEMRKGNSPFFLFEQPGSVLADLAPSKKDYEVRGDIWVSVKY